MRVILIILLVVLALWTILSPVIRYHEKPTWVMAIIIMIPTLILTGFEIRWQFHQNQATEIVQSVSERSEGSAKCQRLSGALTDTALSVKGMVYYANDSVAHLKYETCQNFMSWMESDKQNPTEKEVMAVGVLVHEAIHVSGEKNEALTECKANKKLVQVAEDLGATTVQAEELYSLYMEKISPRMPSQYQNGIC